MQYVFRMRMSLEYSRECFAGSPVGIQLRVTPGAGEAGLVGGNGRVIATHCAIPTWWNHVNSFILSARQLFMYVTFSINF